MVEQTVHVAESHRRRGVGRALLTELIADARALGKTQIVAGIDGAKGASIRFHERLGIREVGRLPAIGVRSGRPLGLVLVQRSAMPDWRPAQRPRNTGSRFSRKAAWPSR